jgi:alpha-galactosidase/6-phospho-beta-glucosidase family protein
MKLTILGGGGVRMPGFVRSVLAGRPGTFDEICLFEPDATRRATTGRLACELATVFGVPGAVTMTADAAQAFTGADYVFSAIRVGGDRGRVIDEQVALRRGIVGQETTGPGGGAMALRTIPVVLSYCELLSQCAPGAVLINFTNPAGLITQAISGQGKVTAVGVCDTPSGTIAELTRFAAPDADASQVSAGYGGLNHLGWITSFAVDGTELLPDLLARFGELAGSIHQFSPFDPEMVQRVGALPTEYVYYYYDSRRYLDGVVRAGSSRGQDVLALNEELLTAIGKAFADGDVHAAWGAYANLLGVRRDTYMRTDVQGDNGQSAARAARASRGEVPIEAAKIGGYEGLALRVIDGLSGRSPSTVIVNVPNADSLGFLEPDDVVEVPTRVDAAGLTSVGRQPELPRSARALIEEVKEYERGIVAAARSGDAGLAAIALAQHPLVPGITAARELLAEYRDAHGEQLAYLR